jgi:hypothetical protein
MSTLRQADLLIDIEQNSTKPRNDQPVIMTNHAGTRRTTSLSVQQPYPIRNPVSEFEDSGTGHEIMFVDRWSGWCGYQLFSTTY